MTDIQIYPLSEKPEYAEICAAWSFGQWGCYFHKENIHNMLKKYEKRAKNKTTMPIVWIAEIDQRIAGMIALKEDDGHPVHMKHLTPWLTAMFVHPLYRNKGVASSLIQTLLNFAKKMNFKEVFLTTPDAEKLYEKHGFQVIGIIPDERGYVETENLMKVSL